VACFQIDLLIGNDAPKLPRATSVICNNLQRSVTRLETFASALQGGSAVPIRENACTAQLRKFQNENHARRSKKHGGNNVLRLITKALRNFVGNLHKLNWSTNSLSILRVEGSIAEGNDRERKHDV
jgi:hypothetical protein